MRGSGTVVHDKRINVWNFLWWQDGKRKSKSLGHHPTKASAWRAAKPLRDALETKTKIVRADVTVRALVDQYRTEKMPVRIDTRRSYEVWLKGHILPKWGTCSLTDLTSRSVELWLDSLALSPKSKAQYAALLAFCGTLQCGQNTFRCNAIQWSL